MGSALPIEAPPRPVNSARLPTIPVPGKTPGRLCNGAPKTACPGPPRRRCANVSPARPATVCSRAHRTARAACSAEMRSALADVPEGSPVEPRAIAEEGHDRPADGPPETLSCTRCKRADRLAVALPASGASERFCLCALPVSSVGRAARRDSAAARPTGTRLPSLLTPGTDAGQVRDTASCGPSASENAGSRRNARAVTKRICPAIRSATCRHRAKAPPALHRQRRSQRPARDAGCSCPTCA
jgi:hypothetical protein